MCKVAGQRREACWLAAPPPPSAGWSCLRLLLLPPPTHPTPSPALCCLLCPCLRMQDVFHDLTGNGVLSQAFGTPKMKATMQGGCGSCPCLSACHLPTTLEPSGATHGLLLPEVTLLQGQLCTQACMDCMPSASCMLSAAGAHRGTYPYL